MSNEITRLSLASYSHNDQEFNLAGMFKATIIKALAKHKGKPMCRVAKEVGLSERTLFRWREHFNLINN